MERKVEEEEKRRDDTMETWDEERKGRGAERTVDAQKRARGECKSKQREACREGKERRTEEWVDKKLWRAESRNLQLRFEWHNLATTMQISSPWLTRSSEARKRLRRHNEEKREQKKKAGEDARWRTETGEERQKNKRRTYNRSFRESTAISFVLYWDLQIQNVRHFCASWLSSY